MGQASYNLRLPYEQHSQLAAICFYLRKRWFGIAGLKMLAVLTVILTEITISGPVVRGELTIALALASVLVGLILASVTCMATYLWQRFACARAVKRAMVQLGLKDTYADYELSEHGIKVTDKTFGGEFSWIDVHEWTENSEMLVIFRSEALYHYFPFAKVESDTIEWMKQRLIQADIRKI